MLMKVKNFNFFYLACSLLIFCQACDNNTDKSNDSEIANENDSTSFIRFADAHEFLSSWSKENTLIYHALIEPDDMHPTNGTNSIRSEINLYTQMALIATDYRNLSLHPTLIKSLPAVSSDNLKYTFELRDEPQWDNGDKLEVKDIVFTCKANICQLTNNPFVKPYWENISDIYPDESNKRKFTVVMKKTYIQNIAFWLDFPILQQKFFDSLDVLSRYRIADLNAVTFDPDKHPDLVKWATVFNDPKYGHDPAFLNGMGMYFISKWDPGQGLTLSKKKNHWTAKSNYYQETSYPEKIIFKVNRDPNSQELEFKSQALDVTGSISTKVLLNLQSDTGFNTNYHSGFIDTYNYSYISLNMRPDGVKQKKFFTDKKVRRAMALLTPVDQLIKVIYKGKNKRMTGPVSFLKPEYNHNLKAIPFDVELAKKLLDEAGWVDTDGDNLRDKIIDGKKTTMEIKLNYYSTTVEWKDMATMMAESMYKAGIKIILNPLDVATMVMNARQHNYDMMLGSWASSMLPEDFTQLWHSSSWSSEGSNYPGFGNAESDALIDSIKYTMNDSIRFNLINKFQQIVYDEQPYIFLFASLRRVAIHKRFGNAEMYFERPGLTLNNLRLLNNGPVQKNSTTP